MPTKPAARIDKAALVQQIIDSLSLELESLARAARSAQAEATDEQSKAENKYDTRGLEASYLARGQSRQAAEVGHAMQQYAALAPRDFQAKEPIDLGALAEVEQAGETVLYFLGPCAGGREIQTSGREIIVLTPQAPLGLELMGKTAGTRWRKNERGREQSLRIVSVQ